MYPIVENIHEKADNQFKQAIHDVLNPSECSGFGIPVKPLIDLILQYTLPTRIICSTFAGPSPGDAVENKLFKHKFQNGTCRQARFNRPLSIVALVDDTYDENEKSKSVNKEKKSMYIIVDAWNYCLRLVSNDRVTTFAGTPGRRGVQNDGPALQTNFDNPRVVIVDRKRPSTRLYVGDWVSVRRMDRHPVTGKWDVSMLSGNNSTGFQDGSSHEARFNLVEDLLCTYDEKKLLVCDKDNSKIRSIDIHDETSPSYGSVKTVSTLRRPVSLVYSRKSSDSSIIISTNLKLLTYNPRTGEVTTTSESNFSLPIVPIVRARLADDLLIGSVGSCVGVFDLQTEEFTHMAGGLDRVGYGNGCARETASFDGIEGMYLDESNASLFVCDSEHSVIRCISPVPLIPMGH